MFGELEAFLSHRCLNGYLGRRIHNEAQAERNTSAFSQTDPINGQTTAQTSVDQDPQTEQSWSNSSRSRVTIGLQQLMLRLLAERLVPRSKHTKKSRQALQHLEDMTFSDAEIDASSDRLQRRANAIRSVRLSRSTDQ